MSFTNRLLLWFHIAFVVFTVGPVTLAIMSSPRAIRTRNLPVLRYLLWMTRIFGAATLGVFAFGMALGQSLNDLGKAWLTASMTLYVVALVVLLLIMRDQRRAIGALEDVRQQESLAEAAAAAEPSATQPAASDAEQEGTATGASPPAPGQATPAVMPAAATHAASVERGRIASLGGIVSIIWVVILVLMVWNT